MPPGEIVERLVTEIDRLNTRFDQLDSRMRKFEAAAAAGVMLAVFFGISVGVGGYFLKAEWDVTQKVRQDTAAVADLTTNVSALQNAVSTVSSAVEKASMPVLSTRIKNFTSAAAAPHYGWSDYESDMQSLSNFAIEYLALLENRNAPNSPQDSALLFSELDKAADAAAQRAKTGLKNINDKYYDLHVDAPNNFKNLVGYLQRHPNTEFSDEELHCYLAAFPNWYYHITHPMTDSPNTPECQALLRIGPA